MSVFEALRGAVDLHMHVGPELGEPRRVDFVEAAQQAHDVGMDAIVFKPLSFPTTDKAYGAMKAVPEIKVYGGIILDWCIGGLNPKAVKVAVEQWGAKVVYFPLFCSANIIRKIMGGGLPGQETYEERLRNIGIKSGEKGITILKQTGGILPEVEEILNIAAENKGTIIDTAHLSPEESLVLIEEARKAGVEYVTVSHPARPVPIGSTPEQLKEMARKGGYLVYCPQDLDPKKLSESVKAVGPKQIVMATDGGILIGPPPVEGLRMFVLSMRRNGITEAEIDVMIKENPKNILGLK
jgi:hypothetical protein